MEDFTMMKNASVQSSPPTITVQVLFFASARDAVDGISSTHLQLDAAVDNAVDTKVLRECLASRYPKLAPLVRDEENITLAVNEEYVPYGQHWILMNGDTVALIPPISGG